MSTHLVSAHAAEREALAAQSHTRHFCDVSALPARPRRLRLALLVLVALFAASAAFVAPASAGKPPLGLYECYLDHDVAYHTLSFTLKSEGRYKVKDGGRGEYTLRKHNKVVKWQSGPFKKFYGIHRHYYAGPLIDIFGKSGGEKFRLVCEHRKN